jgi:hypothetical protein
VIRATARRSAILGLTAAGLMLSCGGGEDGSEEPVASVAVAPTAVTLAPGQTAQFGATLRDAGGNTLSGRAVSWLSSEPAVATVSSTGAALAVSEGITTIRATSEGVSGDARLTVSAASGGSNYALRFYANVLNGLGRVTIPLDNPHRPVDVGDGEMTIEFWLRGRLQDNTEGSVGCGIFTDAWIEGNIVLDRDRFTQPRDYGLALLAGRVAFGVRTASDLAYTMCGAINVLDDQWHHIAVTRRASSGALVLYVDGALDTQADGPSGAISYPDGQTGSPADPLLVLGAEKHDVGPEYPGFHGLLDELRLSTTVRYAAPFIRPTRRFSPDAATAGLYHFDEGAGITLGDASGAAGGPSTGTLRVGGTPAGPTWVLSTAPTGD